MTFSFWKKIFLLIIVVGIIGAFFYFFTFKTAIRTTEEKTVRIEEGSSIGEIAKKLSDEGIVKNDILFKTAFMIYGNSKSIDPGAYKLTPGMSLKEVVAELQKEPWARYVFIPPNKTKDEIGDILADQLGWDLLNRQFFANTYAGMQWQRYHDVIQDVFEAEYEWNRTKKEAFLSLSSLYYSNEFDFFKKAYVPGTYEIPSSSSRAQVAGILIEQFATLHENDEVVGIIAVLDQDAMDQIAQMVEEEMELMPDIVALPALDVVLNKKDGRSQLAFTTSYWNKGRGALELIADPKTRGNKGDLERNVYQRIYRLDGDYTERLSGRFLWHQAHLHYHFEDFAIYSLEPVDIGGAEFTEKRYLKSTFCVRDSEPIDLSHPGAEKGASYQVCGKERQGISPGWADSYYYTYVDQSLDVTGIPKGTYSLKIIVNPEDRFDEITKENNISEVILYIDVEKNKIEILEEKQYGME